MLNKFCVLGFIAGVPSGILAQVINSTLINGHCACQDSEITFTCVTRGSPIIAWFSEAFIGPGGTALTFVAMHHPERTLKTVFDSATVATLVRKYDDGGVQVLVSTLRIIATAGSLIPSVTCTDYSRITTVNFQLLSKGHYINQVNTRMAIHGSDLLLC